MKKENEKLQLILKDDGIAFDAKAIMNSEQKSMGLKNIIQKINFDELVFDVSSIIFIILFSLIQNDSDNNIFKYFNNFSSSIFVILLQFLISFQLGILFSRINKSHYPKFIKNILNITGFLILLFLFLGVPVALSNIGVLDNSNYMVIFIIAIFILIFTPMISFHLADKLIMQRANIKKASFYLKALFFAMLSFSLLCWQNLKILADSKYMIEQHGHNDIFYIIFGLFLSGIIPMRLLMAIAPPVKAINAIIGTLVIVFDILIIMNVI